jgi:hypothetical protein
VLSFVSVAFSVSRFGQLVYGKVCKEIRREHTEQHQSRTSQLKPSSSTTCSALTQFLVFQLPPDSCTAVPTVTVSERASVVAGPLALHPCKGPLPRLSVRLLPYPFSSYFVRTSCSRIAWRSYYAPITKLSTINTSCRCGPRLVPRSLLGLAELAGGGDQHA